MERTVPSRSIFILDLTLIAPIKIGEKFGKLTVIAEAPPRGKAAEKRVEAQCDCGSVKQFRFADLRSGNTSSCGCKRAEVNREQAKKYHDIPCYQSCGSLVMAPIRVNRKLCRDCKRKSTNASARKYRREKYSEKAAWYVSDWVKKNPDKSAAIKRQYRARKRGAEGVCTSDEWKEILQKYANKCVDCGRSEPEIKMTVGHAIPLKRGGSNWPKNLIPQCMSCNGAQGAHWIHPLADPQEVLGLMEVAA